MKKTIRIAFSLFVAWALAACASTGQRGVTTAERNTFAQNDIVISRVEFKDANVGRKIAITHEALETNYDKGNMLIEVGLEDFEQMRALESQYGYSIEIDPKNTTQQSNLIQSYNAGGFPKITTQTIPSYPCYRTVEETFATAASIATNYPNLATWTDAGNSWVKTQNAATGYDMFVLKLTNKSITGTKPKLFITSAIHAREYTTAELMTRFAEYLVQNYATNADIKMALDYNEVHLMLQTNPDGRKKAEAGVLWRKNANTKYCTRSSTKGADLNRNFGFEWGTGGSSTNQCDETYRGPSAVSEPETQAVQNYALSIFADNRGPLKTDAVPANAPGMYLDIHSYSQLVLWPWGNTATVAPNATALQTLGRKLAFFNNYTPQQSIGLYATSGTTIDYMYGTLGVAGYTMELGTSFFQACTDFTSTILPQNLEALKFALKVARAPYQLPAGPDALSLSFTGTTLNASINDTRFNNANGAESTQTVASAEYSIDTAPWAGGTLIAMTSIDGAFNASTEAVSANINTTGLTSGQHTVFVRGTDAAGNVGPVSAIFLTVP